jgi:tubulin polyglutamylase TTLL6/13
MMELTRKNNLGKNLNRMKKKYEDEYTFFPQTWLLPTDLAEFRMYNATSVRERRFITYIVKPEASC